MITYTDEIKPVRHYSAREILCMSPSKLKLELSKLISMEPDMADKIEATLGYEFKWSDISTYAYFLVAVCWSKLEDPLETQELLKDMKVDQRIQDILKD